MPHIDRTIHIEDGKIVIRMPITESNVIHVDNWVGEYTHDDAFMDLITKYVRVRKLRTTVDAPS